MAVALTGPLSRKLALRDEQFVWSPPPLAVIGALAMVVTPPRSGDGGIEVRRAKVSDVIAEVCREFEICRKDLISDARFAWVVRPRQIAMWLARRVTTRSLPEIGRLFGHRDHTTVIHAIRKVDELIARDPELRAHLFEIAARFTTTH
jgi:hypothetical protein